MNDGYRWGGSADLTPFETVMWRSEVDPHLRSNGVLVELLDQEPDWERYFAALERSTLKVPRLRERIVEPAVPVVAPAWSPDEYFDIRHHVYRMRLPDPGTMAQLHEVVADVIQRPLDTTRPPWEAVLVTGLEGGRAASLFKSHHVLADGAALTQLFELVHSHTSVPGPRRVPEPPARPSVGPFSLVAKRMASRAAAAPRELLDFARSMPGRVLRNPVTTTNKAVDYALSLRRQISSTGVERSPLLKGQGGLGSGVLTFDVPLASLRAAGKAAGGSINDAYLAGMVGGLRRYHEHFGVDVDRIPLTIPVNTRTARDGLGGNHFSAVHITGPLAERDPRRRIELLREQVRQARSEPAIRWIDATSMLFDKLPAAALVELVLSNTSVSDVQLSNFPGVGWEAYVAGAKVTGVYAIGARPGVAMMAALVSYEGKACFGLHLDPDAFSDLDVLEKCLREGFAEVFTLIPESEGGES